MEYEKQVLTRNKYLIECVPTTPSLGGYFGISRAQVEETELQLKETKGPHGPIAMVLREEFASGQ